MTVVSDGKPYGTFPVSLGATNTPTARGTKVIMEKGASICMRGPGYYECGVKYTQRLTYGGEYLHSAPWNLGNIGRFDSSNGCTNLRPADAKQLYDFLGVGDVVSTRTPTGRRCSSARATATGTCRGASGRPAASSRCTDLCRLGPSPG